MSVFPDHLILEPDPPSPRLCDVCRQEIHAEAQVCTKCSSPQDGKNCIVCCKRIAKGSDYCSGCSNFQNWRRRMSANHTTLALFVALLSIAGTAFTAVTSFLSSRSQTSASFLEMAFNERVDDEQAVLRIRLQNDGNRPADVEHARVAFGTPLIADAKLDPVNRASTRVPANGSSDVDFYVYELDVAGGMPDDKVQLEAKIKELAKQLCTARVELYVIVKERDRFGELEPPKELPAILIPREDARTWTMQRIGKVKDEDRDC